MGAILTSQRMANGDAVMSAQRGNDVITTSATFLGGSSLSVQVSATVTTSATIAGYAQCYGIVTAGVYTVAGMDGSAVLNPVVGATVATVANIQGSATVNAIVSASAPDIVEPPVVVTPYTPTKFSVRAVVVTYKVRATGDRFSIRVKEY